MAAGGSAVPMGPAQGRGTAPKLLHTRTPSLRKRAIIPTGQLEAEQSRTDAKDSTIHHEVFLTASGRGIAPHSMCACAALRNRRLSSRVFVSSKLIRALRGGSACLAGANGASCSPQESLWAAVCEGARTLQSVRRGAHILACPKPAKTTGHYCRGLSYSVQTRLRQ